MNIEPGKTYKLAPGGPHSQKYFHNKYGTATPEYELEDEFSKVFNAKDPWQNQFASNPGVMIFAMRSGLDKMGLKGPFYYGKVNGMGEIVHESELKELAR